MGARFDRAIFARLWNDHSIPTQRIAEAMGVTRQTVSWHAHQMGLPSRAGLRHRKADPALLREMWLAGVSAREIAEHFGMAHHACVVTAAKNLGLPGRVRGPAGYRNGGWVANLPIAEFWQAKLAARMEEFVRSERAA